MGKDKWEQLKGIKTKTSGFTLIQAIACAVEFDNQHCGIYAGDWDSYKDFAPVFDPLICEYHGISPSAKHTSDMDASKIKGNVNEDVPVHSCRIRVGRSIDGFGLSPGITKEQRVGVEKLMINAVKNFPSDLAGKYYPLTGMNEQVRQQLVDDHFLFVSGDRNLTVAGMERDWPEGRGIFHNEKKTFLIWVNEEDQLRIISMQMGGDVRGVFERLAKGIKCVQESVKKGSGKDFCLDERFGYIHSCPTNLGTGMRASVHVDLPGWTQHGLAKLQARCEELHLQPRGTRGESGGQTGFTYDISNKHRLGYSEVQLVQKMIDGVNKLWEEDKKYQKQYFGDLPFIASQHSLVAKHVTRKSGTSSRTSRPRPLDLPWLRPSPVLFSLTTNTAVSMLVTGIHTRTSLLSSTLSSKSTTESAPLPSTPLIWMSERLRVMLLTMLPSTPAEFVSVAPSMASVFHPESPRNSVLELKS